MHAIQQQKFPFWLLKKIKSSSRHKRSKFRAKLANANNPIITVFDNVKCI